MVPYDRRPRCQIRGHAFADIAIGADREHGRPAAIAGTICGGEPSGGERMDHGARADAGMAGQIADMRKQPAAVADRHMRADGAIRGDAYVRSDRRPGLIRAEESIMAALMYRKSWPTCASATILARHFGLAAIPPHHLALGDLVHVVLDSIARQNRLAGRWSETRLRLARLGCRDAKQLRRSAPCPRSSARRETPDCSESVPEGLVDGHVRRPMPAVRRGYRSPGSTMRNG